MAAIATTDPSDGGSQTVRQTGTKGQSATVTPQLAGRLPCLESACLVRSQIKGLSDERRAITRFSPPVSE